jgi:hypothetical protein
MRVFVKKMYECIQRSTRTESRILKISRNFGSGTIAKMILRKKIEESTYLQPDTSLLSGFTIMSRDTRSKSWMPYLNSLVAFQDRTLRTVWAGISK